MSCCCSELVPHFVYGLFLSQPALENYALSLPHDCPDELLAAHQMASCGRVQAPRTSVQECYNDCIALEHNCILYMMDLLYLVSRASYTIVHRTLQSILFECSRKIVSLQ